MKHCKLLFNVLFVIIIIIFIFILALREAVDLKCFNKNIPKLRECFRSNNFFKNYTSLLTDSKINFSPRNFPNHVIKTSQPSFLTDIK